MSERITVLLRELHWSRVSDCIQFWLCVLAYHRVHRAQHQRILQTVCDQHFRSLPVAVSTLPTSRHCSFIKSTFSCQQSHVSCHCVAGVEQFATMDQGRSISAAYLQALQSVLNAGAHLIMRKHKYDHITSTLRDDLHWLPVHQRILYKLYTILYKCIYGAAPSYRTNLCVPVATITSRRYLRSATHGDLLMPRTRMVTYGPRSLAVFGRTLWNTLPSTLRVSATTLGQFQSGLKTILFCLAYGT